MLRGTNLPAVSAYNQSLVLDLIRRSDGLSRVELAELTGLSTQTLSNVTKRLIGEGFVREAGKAVGGPGKPRTILALNPTARYGVGIHVDPSVLTTVLLDLSGEVVAHRSTSVEPTIAPAEAIQELAAGVSELIAGAGVPIDRVSGIGVAAPGPLDTVHGRMFSPPLLARWHDVAIGAELAAATGLEVVVEKDVTAAIIAETWLNVEQPTGDAMFLYYGTGIGAAFTVSGAVARGASSNAGEIGHMVVDPDGPVCRCGRRGCLGDSVAPRALLEEAVAAGVGGVEVHVVSRDLAAGWQQFAAALRDEDAAAWQIANAFTARLARAIVISCSMLDLDAVILGGPDWAVVSDLLLSRVATAVEQDPGRLTPTILRISSSELGPDVVAIGAGCLILDRAYSARPDDLLIES